ncbi:MAG TPA: cupin domain-containing protein [Candidatus Gemmiger excrementipullorum]|uniref:Cupin domain-containing protein n=1 Tax=Candidatus Gemmiger excrementipullorum TaxID=2838610 RepID=A0A9D1Y2D5_9FIRM|nr:cupin domain-containing protein [Candidatus Gemmiger excrementipullorum]
MVRSCEEKIYDRKPSPFHGKGEILVRSLLNGPEEMYEAGRVFGHTTVFPGSAIGYHVHEHESETYYILSGTARFNDNGTVRTVTAGDVTFTGAGQGHGIEAVGNEPVEMIALILYDKRADA